MEGMERSLAYVLAGRGIVTMEDLAEQIKGGMMDFDVVIASPDAMRVVGQLGQILGRSQAAGHALVEGIRVDHPPISEEWRYAGAKWGWSLRLKHKKRAVLYLTPAEGFFYAGLALGQKAVDAAHQSGLPSDLLAVIDGSQGARDTLYALFKQATSGDVEGKRPGFTDPVGRAKFDAWSKVKGLSHDEAKQQYISTVSDLLA